MAKGNMYDDITHTWNTVKGKCYYDHDYCYMKRWGELPEVHFDESELKTDLGENNHIFVGSSCDMWSPDIPDDWIIKTLQHCEKYHENVYRFQTRNVGRFRDFTGYLFRIYPELGTTIETNRWLYKDGPQYIKTNSLREIREFGYRTFITIEPIHDFDVDELYKLIKQSCVDTIFIGANTNKVINHREPKKEKIEQLIKKLSGIEVYLKSNLKRLLDA